MTAPREVTADTLTDAEIRAFRRDVLLATTVPYSLQRIDERNEARTFNARAKAGAK